MNQPVDPRDAGLGPELDDTLAALEAYARDSADLPAPGFAERVMEAVAAEPAPRRGLLAALLGATGGGARPVRLAAIMATAAMGIVLVVAAGGVADLVRRNAGGPPSASPTVRATPTPTPTPSASPTPTPSASPTPTPTPTLVPTPSLPPSTPSQSPGESNEPSASEDERSSPSGTAEPSDDGESSGED